MIIKKYDDYKVVVEALENEGICLIPTETVYGVCVRYDSINAYNKIMDLKRRPKEKTLPIAVGSYKQIEDIAILNDYQRYCIQRLLPGPITVIVKAKNIGNHLIKNGTIAVRYSNDEYLNKVINELDKPILLTSANLSGFDPFTNIKDAEEVFKDQISVYVDGELVKGMPSTIVDLTTEELNIVRVGPISKEEILERIKQDGKYIF